MKNGEQHSLAAVADRAPPWPDRLAAALAGNGAKTCRSQALRGLGRAPAEKPMPAAVLIALIGWNAPGVLLTRRHETLAQHPGQVAFPGGAEEPGDANSEAAALREAREEVGLAPERVRVLGRLPRYATSTGYLIAPVVGHVAEPPPFVAQPGEVADIFVVPVAVLLDRAQWRKRTFEVAGKRTELPELTWHERRIWGATAGMLQLLLPLLREVWKECA